MIPPQLQMASPGLLVFQPWYLHPHNTSTSAEHAAAPARRRAAAARRAQHALQWKGLLVLACRDWRAPAAALELIPVRDGALQQQQRLDCARQGGSEHRQVGWGGAWTPRLLATTARNNSQPPITRSAHGYRHSCVGSVAHRQTGAQSPSRSWAGSLPPAAPPGAAPQRAVPARVPTAPAATKWQRESLPAWIPCISPTRKKLGQPEGVLTQQRHWPTLPSSWQAWGPAHLGSSSCASALHAWPPSPLQRALLTCTPRLGGCFRSGPQADSRLAPPPS